MTAGLWFFLFHWLTSRPKPAVEQPLRDAEFLLQQAQQEMRENQAKNRERAVQVITQKNNLLAERDKLNAVVLRLRERAKEAAATGNREEEERLLSEAVEYLPTVVCANKALERAEEATQSIKDAIRHEEQRIRAKTAQAMAMKSVWKQAQISAAIEQQASPVSQNRRSTQAILDDVLRRIASTRDALGREAEAAIKAENYTVAIRLLAEQQNLEQAIVFGSSRR